MEVPTRPLLDVTAAAADVSAGGQSYGSSDGGMTEASASTSSTDFQTGVQDVQVHVSVPAEHQACQQGPIQHGGGGDEELFLASSPDTHNGGGGEEKPPFRVVLLVTLPIFMGYATLVTLSYFMKDQFDDNFRAAYGRPMSPAETSLFERVTTTSLFLSIYIYIFYLQYLLLQPGPLIVSAPPENSTGVRSIDEA